MSKKLKTFRYSCSIYAKIGLAPSKAAFMRIANITQAESAYLSETGNAKEVALAEEAGAGYFMEATRAEGWARRRSYEARENDALIEIRAKMDGTGNTPKIAVERGETVKGQFSSTSTRIVYIDGEERGRWTRPGARWHLEDTTGHRCKTRRTWWWFAAEGEVRAHEYYSEPFDVMIDQWNEAAALMSVLEAWQDDQLPPVAEQKARAAKREAARNAEKELDKMQSRLEPHFGDLIKLLESDPRPEAARLLTIMRTPTKDEDDD